MYDRSNYDYISRKYLFPEFMRLIESDDDPGGVIGSQLEDRGKVYTRLIDDYAGITKIRNISKEIHKWIFFWLIVVVGAIVVIMGCNIIQRVLLIEDTAKFLESTPIIITVFATLLSSIIGIPLTITKFLFNEKEDENITKTIYHTQKHDFREINLLRDRYTKSSKNNPSDTKDSESDSDEFDIDDLYSDDTIEIKKERTAKINFDSDWD